MAEAPEDNFRDYLAHRFAREAIATLIASDPLNISKAEILVSGNSYDLWQDLLSKFEPDQIRALAVLVTRRLPEDAELIAELSNRWLMARPKLMKVHADNPRINRGPEIGDFAVKIQAHFKEGTCPPLVLVTGWEDEGQIQLVDRLCSDELSPELAEGSIVPYRQVCSPKTLRLREGRWSEEGIRFDIEKAIKEKFGVDLKKWLERIRLGQEFYAVRLTVRTEELTDTLHLETLAAVCQSLAQDAGNKLVVFYCVRFDRIKLPWWSLRRWLGPKVPPLVTKLRNWRTSPEVPRHVIVLNELDDVHKADVERAMDEALPASHPVPETMSYETAYNLIEELRKANSRV